jgi:hypothetical protein
MNTDAEKRYDEYLMTLCEGWFDSSLGHEATPGESDMLLERITNSMSNLFPGLRISMMQHPELYMQIEHPVLGPDKEVCEEIWITCQELMATRLGHWLLGDE